MRPLKRAHAVDNRAVGTPGGVDLVSPINPRRGAAGDKTVRVEPRCPVDRSLRGGHNSPVGGEDPDEDGGTRARGRCHLAVDVDGRTADIG